MSTYRVVFGDKKLKESYENLLDSKTEDKMTHKWISRAIEDLKENPFCGIQIPKKQIPKYYLRKYDIDNLWKYNLPNAWRMLYSVANDEVHVISIVLDWMSHKQYNKKFNYLF